jgi:hypothetical protein
MDIEQFIYQKDRPVPDLKNRQNQDQDDQQNMKATRTRTRKINQNMNQCNRQNMDQRD